MNAELIKALRCCGTVTEPCRECPYGQGEGCRIDNLDFSAADALEAADKRIAELEALQRWISVEERLPDGEAEEVLLTDGESCYTGFWREDAKGWDNVNQGWVRSGTDEKGRSILAQITHWCPLPQPPQKGE